MTALPDLIVNLPDGTLHRLPNNPGNCVIKQIIEQFAVNYLKMPKVVRINPYPANAPRAVDARAPKVPDVLLADLAGEPLFYFCEVARNGLPITERRKQDLLKTVLGARVAQTTTQFVTALATRPDAPFRKLYERIAPDTLLWHATEPNRLTDVVAETRWILTI